MKRFIHWLSVGRNFENLHTLAGAGLLSALTLVLLIGAFYNETLIFFAAISAGLASAKINKIRGGAK